MRKKGFTLIELLAVIVILAIIAVITVPKIADMISSSRMGGAEDSFYGTLKAAELGYTKALQSKTELKGDICDLSKASGDKVTCTNGTVIAFTGKVPEKGTLVIDDSGSTIAKEITLNGYKCYGDLSTKNPCVKTTDKVAGETLIAKGTSSGIYNDTYDTSRYVFKGSNPNNNLIFNEDNEKWRIVSVEADGTLKIIKEEALGTIPFDSRVSETEAERFNSNNTYCTINKLYIGCNAWNAVQGTFTNGYATGTVSDDSTLNKYLNGRYYNVLLTSDAKNQIQYHSFNKGATKWQANFQSVVSSELTDSWRGNVALLNISDYLKASNSSSCTANTNPFYVTGSDDGSCSNNNYLYQSGAWWTLLTPRNYGINEIFIVRDSLIYTRFTYIGDNIRPVMYLKANIKLTGSGTSSDPYEIA